MPLPLDDSRWSELDTAYGQGTDDLLGWLREAYTGKISDDLLGEIINEVQHQGGTSAAMYAVATHFIDLAKLHEEHALHLLISAGWTYADSGARGAAPCPTFLKEEFAAYAKIGASLLLPYLLKTKDFSEYMSAVTALSGFLGHDHFGRFLMGLEYFQGKYRHVSLEKPDPK